MTACSRPVLWHLDGWRSQDGGGDGIFLGECGINLLKICNCMCFHLITTYWRIIGHHQVAFLGVHTCCGDQLQGFLDNMNCYSFSPAVWLLLWFWTLWLMISARKADREVHPFLFSWSFEQLLMPLTIVSSELPCWDRLGGNVYWLQFS